MFKPAPIPIDHHPAVLLFEDIQDRLTEQRSYEEQTQAELNKAKATQASAESASKQKHLQLQGHKDIKYFRLMIKRHHKAKPVSRKS